MFPSIWQHCQIMKDHSNVTNMHFWMIQRDKREGFGHFLDLGQFNRLGIAYYDRTKCFPTFGNSTRSWRIIQKSLKSILNDSTCQKEDVLDFWLLDRLHIEYFVRTKCFPRFGNVTRSCFVLVLGFLHFVCLIDWHWSWDRSSWTLQFSTSVELYSQNVTS